MRATPILARHGILGLRRVFRNAFCRTAICARIRVEVDHLGLMILGVVMLVAGCTPSTVMSTARTPAITVPLAPAQEPPPVDTAERLVSRPIDSPPVVDGQVDRVWGTADPLAIRLTWGMHSREHALDLELRSLYTNDTVHFLARWPGEPPSGEENTVFNRITLHWRIPEPEAQRMDCEVACHTAFADGGGRFVYANAETIPQGGSGALPVAGGWEDGVWTLEWSRPLLNGNPFDLQFADLDRTYTFLVKVFERIEGRPDPISERRLLVFQR